MKITNLKSIIFIILIFSNIAYAQQPEKTGAITGGTPYTMLPWFKASFLEITDDVDETKEENKHVMLFFHLSECPYCDQMIKNFEKPLLKEFIQQHFDVIAINILGSKEVAITEEVSLTEKELATKVGVQYTPTIIFLNQNNETVARTNGYRKPEKFKQVLAYVHDKAYKDSTLAQYIEKTKETSSYQLQSNAMFKKFIDFSIIKRPLAIIFEDKNCDACAYFHNTTLKDETVINEFSAFKVVRFDADSTQTIIDNNGNKTTPKAWAQQLKLNYRPGIILFDKGHEITRIDGFLYKFHFQEVLRYVSGGFYQEFKTYNAYLAERQKQLLEQGVDIDISK